MSESTETETETARAAVDKTIAALGSADRPADAGLVTLARKYADAIDGPSFDDEGLDPLARYGPKLTVVLERLHAHATVALDAPGASEPVAPAGPVTIEDRMARARREREERRRAEGA